MNDILTSIVTTKRKEVEILKAQKPLSKIEQCIDLSKGKKSMKDSILNSENFGIIAEYKRKSPSKGPFINKMNVMDTALGYIHAGASGISILTDEFYFGGNTDDIVCLNFNSIPILRKEFIIDAYQIFEAKHIGADAILLIAEILSKEEIKTFTKVAHELVLEVILEMHSIDQLVKIYEYIDILGINNRDLHTFTTDINTSISIKPHLPKDMPCISESGIHHPEDVKVLTEEGYLGFLIGEQFLTHENPGKALQEFIKKIKTS